MAKAERMEVSEEHPAEVRKWRGRYARAGFSGLTDLPRPMQPRKLDPVVAKRTLKMTAKTIPHRLQNFQISKHRRFAEKVVEVVGLYMDPADNAVVLSVDEKTPIQVLDRPPHRDPALHRDTQQPARKALHRDQVR